MPCAGLLLIPILLLLPQPPASDCADVASCRQAAIEAAARSDVEAFHDLAWRTAQKGRPNDPELMLLIARAQSLSGRPGDALVMLRRLAEMGIATDAAQSDDYRRVRALPGWPAVEALITGAAAKAAVEPAPPVATPAKSPPPPKPEPPAKPAPAPDKATSAVEAPAAPTPTAGGEEALPLGDVTLNPVDLAYDAASRRFVVGDSRANKLIVADEVFEHVNDLIGAASAGFGTLTGLAIDSRRGDLWVTSNADGGAPSLHKLQLVSGRVLSTIQVPEEMRPAAFGDIAITDSGALLLVDSTGSRLLTVRPAGDRFDRSVALDLQAPSTIAPSGRVTYVAHQDGVAIADMKTGRVTEIRAAKGVTLKGMRRIRFSRGSLVAIQADPEDGTDRLVRIRLARGGTRATAVEPLDNELASAGSALTISRDAAYYVATTDHGLTIRRVPLR
ncbi:MAG: hypothetical protein ACRD15_20500 [Vicinamibacterales bacterium]